MFSDTHIAMAAQRTALADFVLVGDVGCGKTTLMKALLTNFSSGKHSEVLKTQAVVFHKHNVIDTPGEFIGRKSYYGALLATIAEVSTLVYLQVANNPVFSMPVGLLQIYPNKRIVGVISKIDLPDADVAATRKLLQENAIAEPYFEISVETGQGINRLRDHLMALQGEPIDSGSQNAIKAA